MTLFYGDDGVYDVQEGDEVAVVAADWRFPAVIKKVMPKREAVIVSFDGIDPVLDLIILRKTARLPLSAIKFVQRGF